MAKKGLLVLVLAALVAGGAFAQVNFSFGGGGFFASDFGGGIEATMAGGLGTMKTEMPYTGGGGYLFFDASYAELSFGFFSGGGDSKSTQTYGGTSTSTTTPFKATSLNIGLLGKFPIAVSDSLTVFPAVGIDYQAVVAATQDGEAYKNRDGDEAPGDFSALWIQFGGGVDYSFTSNIFLRCELLYGIRIANKFENDMVDFLKEMMPGITANPLPGHGLTIKLAIGWRF
jgi:hypothetical protein